MSSVCFEIIVAAFRELCNTGPNFVTVVQFHEIFALAPYQQIDYYHPD